MKRTHMILLATGPAGYRSLCRLSSLVQGHSERQAIAACGLNLEQLRNHSKGLICLGGGRRGWVGRSVRAGNHKVARHYVEYLVSIYQDNTYLGLELHTSKDATLGQEIVALGVSYGIPTAAVQPVYCLSADDLPKLRLLAAIDRNCSLDAVPLTALPNGGDSQVSVHWLDRAEMTARFAQFPDALVRTGEIARRCQPALLTGKMLWPTLDLPNEQTPRQVLIELAQSGLVERYGSQPSTVVQARLDKELDAVIGYGYAPLFIIVADIVRFARTQDIPLCTRGSVANSLLAYCSGITSVDPIEHDLLFERFLSPARADVPDIDLDFCSRRRDEVLNYVRDKYGQDRVALVSTVSTLQLRSAIREVAKAYGLDKVRLKPLLKGLPRGWRPAHHRRQLTEDELLDKVDDPLLRKVMQAGYGIVGQPHHLSVHPGGVVITPGPLTDTLPVQWAPKGFLITQFDHQDVDALGLPKIDLLGIRALTVLADAADLVRRDHKPEFRLDAIPANDSTTAKLLAEGDTIGAFQCDSEGARRTLRQLRAHTVRDLAVTNAFFKPGPATGGMADAFVRRYRGEAAVGYLHPALKVILASTKGVLLFQEQILRVAVEIADLSWEQAGFLRRGMSKMDPVEMAQMQAEFVTGCQRPPPDGPDFTPELAQQLWQQVQTFSGYGFNQGHATAYADVSYRSTYLKAHWPAAFFCARLKGWGGYHHPAVYMAEAIRLGIAVRPPHVNHSGRNFDLAWEDEQPVLWMGLGLVRDVRRRTVVEIIKQRQRRPFVDLRDVLSRVSLQDKEIRHLIQCGTLDGLGDSRQALLDEAETIRRAGSVQQLAFGFFQRDVPAESLIQRLAWEQHLLGYPIQAIQVLLPKLATQYSETKSLQALFKSPGRQGAVLGVRLPGWGQDRFYLWDGETWALVKTSQDQPLPSSWQPLHLQGYWMRDEWGMVWVQAKVVERIEGLGEQISSPSAHQRRIQSHPSNHTQCPPAVETTAAIRRMIGLRLGLAMVVQGKGRCVLRWALRARSLCRR